MKSIDFSDIEDDRLSGKSPLDCARKVELRILRIFDRICRENGLQYCLAYGTLLGAVRHGGFIPWDDDIDVHMPMEDYKRFVKIASDVLPDEIGFYHGKQTQCGFGKLIDSKSFYLDETSKARMEDVPEGIFVDVFPLRPYWSARLHERTLAVVRHGILKAHPIGKLTLTNLVKRWFWIVVNKLFFFPLDKLNSIIGGENVGSPQWMWGSTKVFPHSPFPTSSIKFEGFYFPAPRNVDEYLRTRYGDYMKLPPENERFVHAGIIIPFVGTIDAEYNVKA